MMTNFLPSMLRIFSSARNVMDTRNSLNIIQHKCFCLVSVPGDERTTSATRLYRTSAASLLHDYFKDVGSRMLAQKFVLEFPKVRSVVKSQLSDLLTLLQRHGYSWLDVQRYRDVLLLTPAQFQSRVTLLQEFSIPHPVLHEVLHINKTMEMPIATLRVCGVYTPDTEVFGHLLTVSTKDLQLPFDVVEDFCTLYQDNDNATLKELYVYLLKHYLALRFSKDKAEAEACLRDSCNLCEPLRTFVRRCDFLLESLGLDFSEVRENVFLLGVDVAYAERILQRCPSIGGTPTMEIVRALPKLILTSNVELWVKLLKKYKVTNFTFTNQTLLMFTRCKMGIVEKRLKVLCQLPEWEVVKVSNKLFSILRSPQNVQKLLTASESGQGISSLNLILANDEGKMRLLILEASPELLTYLGHHLGITEADARDLMSEGFHLPYGIANTKKVLMLLFDFGFTREQIMSGMLILGLECGIVEQALRLFPYHHSSQPFSEWMENPFVLHLLAYCIKKDFLHPEVLYRKKKIKQ